MICDRPWQLLKQRVMCKVKVTKVIQRDGSPVLDVMK